MAAKVHKIMIYPIEIKGKTKAQVTKINLSGKGLREIPENIYEYINLEKLDLSHNKIEVIPKEIVKLKKLRSLNLSFNNLTVLQSALFKLPKLKTLNLHGNKLKSLPKQLENCKLDILILSKNQFNGIEESLIKNIDKVDIVDNPMSRGLINQEIKVDETVKHQKKEMKRLNIFISYSHKDSEWLDRLEVHLKGLSNYYNEIDAWDDRRIKSSQEWHKEIEKALLKSNVAILLVSADFMASDYIHNHELQPLLDKASKNKVKIIPVFVGPTSLLDESGVDKYEGPNHPEKTLSECTKPEAERYLSNLIDDIKGILNA